MKNLHQDIKYEYQSVNNMFPFTNEVFLTCTVTPDLLKVDENKNSNEKNFNYNATKDNSELLNDFLNLEDSNGNLVSERLIEFIQNYGLLGYYAISNIDNSSYSTKTDSKYKYADPLFWIQDHIHNVKTCIEIKKIIDLISTQSIKKSSEYVRTLQKLENVLKSLFNDDDNFAIKIGTKECFFDKAYAEIPYPENKTLEWAQEIITFIMRNLMYMRFEFIFRNNNPIVGFNHKALIVIVYYYLSQVLSDDMSFHICEADDCNHIFYRSHLSQRYCDKETLPNGESKCQKRQYQKNYRLRNSKTSTKED